MLLAIDIGNTHTVIGLFDNEMLIASWRLQSDQYRTIDEYALQLLTLLKLADTSSQNLQQVIIASVVPPLGQSFGKLSRKFFQLEPIFVGPDINLGVEIRCDDPRLVGADRIVNALAAKILYKVPAVVVDLGTATTLDVIAQDGGYEGGIIAPGLLISAQALFEKGAMLMSTELQRPERLIGKNTRDSMLSGIIYGYVSLVDGLLERLKQELGANICVIATGGFAKLIAELSLQIEHVDPDLTLKGLQIVARQNPSPGDSTQK